MENFKSQASKSWRTQMYCTRLISTRPQNVCVESSEVKKNCNHINLHIYYLLSSFIVILPDGKRSKKTFFLLLLNVKSMAQNLLSANSFITGTSCSLLEVLSSKRAKKSLTLFNAHEPIRNSKTRKRLNIIRPTSSPTPSLPITQTMFVLDTLYEEAKLCKAVSYTYFSPEFPHHFT